MKWGKIWCQCDIWEKLHTDLMSSSAADLPLFSGCLVHMLHAVLSGTLSNFIFLNVYTSSSIQKLFCHGISFGIFSCIVFWGVSWSCFQKCSWHLTCWTRSAKFKASSNDFEDRRGRFTWNINICWGEINKYLAQILQKSGTKDFYLPR